MQTPRVELAPAQTPLPRIPTEPQSETNAPTPSSGALGERAPDLVTLYQQLNPGVVSIQVLAQRGSSSGQGAGSGFILDDSGYIVTNNHVVSGATQVIVIFYEDTGVEAEVVGTDADSDLAVLKVDALPDGAHSLPLGNSDQVQVGESVVAIGNPFGYEQHDGGDRERRRAHLALVDAIFHTQCHPNRRPHQSGQLGWPTVEPAWRGHRRKCPDTNGRSHAGQLGRRFCHSIGCRETGSSVSHRKGRVSVALVGNPGAPA